jgi:hypothetical protein
MATPVTPRPTPVFVLGLQRSGTTWLANVFAQHSRAVAVQSAHHFGIFESIFFSHFAAAYGDLNDEANFRRFAASFVTSEYYLLSGLDPGWLTTLNVRSYPEIFRAMMEEVARRQGGADFWVEKSPDHTHLADELAATFPDARFICIVRQPQSATASMLWLRGAPQSQSARVRELLGLSLFRAQQRLLTHFCHRHQDRCFLTRYEDFVANSEAETRSACKFLGIDYEPAMLDLPWQRNTSFHSMDRRHAFHLPDRIIMAAARALLNLVPLRLLRFILTWHRARRQKRQGGIVFPKWTWRSRDAELNNPLHDLEQSKPVDRV